VLEATKSPEAVCARWDAGCVVKPAKANEANLRSVFECCEAMFFSKIDASRWLEARYKPTRTIIEAAKAFYVG
jgi:hypothetical protein